MPATSHRAAESFAFTGRSVSLEGLTVAHVPWFLALLIAPLCFGGVGEIAQIVLGLLITLSLVLAAGRLRSIPESRLGRVAALGMIGIVVLSLFWAPRPLSATVELQSIARESAAQSFAPGATIVRAWQLAMLAGCFLLARDAVQLNGFSGWFTRGLALTTILLGCSELWRLADGNGVWGQARHYPAGTFANRNHYANWMVAAAMFIFGALLRKIRSRSEERGSDRTDIPLFTLALLIAIGTTVACGSRGGLLALVVGFCAWAVILWRRAVKGATLAVFGIVAAIAVVIFVFAGDLVMSRATEGGLFFKTRIWRDTFRIFLEFPIVGIGLGAFADVFSILKTFHGEGTVLFAENEFLEWAAETGVIGILVGLMVLVCVGRIIAKGLKAERIPRSELFFGALAALAAILAHAVFEFVFHVTATALLSAALLGVAVGTAQKASRKVEPLALKSDLAGTLALALVIGFFGLQQAKAAQRWRSADHWTEHRAASAEWPLHVDRAILAARSAMAAGAQIDARSILDDALRHRPYHWELRVELAWLKLAKGGKIEEAVTEARRAVATNPLQPKVPLRFASMLATLHPAYAAEFLKMAPVRRYEDVREALRIAWNIERNGALLWELTPPTRDGLEALAQFAREQNLQGLADEAQRQAKEKDDTGSRH